MSKHTKWREEEKITVFSMLALGMTLNEIALHIGRTYEGVRRMLRNHRKKSNQFGVALGDLKELPATEELIKYIEKGQDLMRRFDPRQREVFPEYKTDKWIGIIFQGDWHFEHYKTDLPAIREDLKAIGAEQDVFYVFNGDVGDWGDIRFKDFNMPSVMLPIQLRYKMIHYMFKQIPNLLAVVSGCHDDWLKNRGWYDIIEAIQEKTNESGVPTYYLGYGGAIDFRVGKADYRMGIYHKFGNESQTNPFHPNTKYLIAHDNTADIVAIAHRHDITGISYMHYQHKPRILVRSGSHQYITDYAWKEGFAGAIAKTPMVLLNGKKKEMRACPTYQEGLEVLRMLNK